MVICLGSNNVGRHDTLAKKRKKCCVLSLPFSVSYISRWFSDYQSFVKLLFLCDVYFALEWSWALRITFFFLAVRVFVVNVSVVEKWFGMRRLNVVAEDLVEGGC